MSAADHAATIRDLIPEPEDVGDEERATVEHAHDALAALVTQAERAVWLEDELDECDKRADKAEARADHAAIVRENLAGNHEAMQALAALVTQADDWRDIARMRTAQAEAAEARADQLHAELVEVKEAATALAKSRNELHARADQLQRERDELRAQVGRLELGAEALRLDVQKALARADQLQRERDEALLETSETRHEMGEWLAEERARRERAETALRAIAEDDELVDANPEAFGLHAYRRCVAQARAALADSGEPTMPGDVPAAPEGECNGCRWGWERYKNPNGIWLHRNATDTLGCACTRGVSA